jgi:hypothetical protein
VSASSDVADDLVIATIVRVMFVGSARIVAQCS